MHTDVFLRVDAVVDHYFLALEKYGEKVSIDNEYSTVEDITLRHKGGLCCLYFYPFDRLLRSFGKIEGKNTVLVCSLYFISIQSDSSPCPLFQQIRCDEKCQTKIMITVYWLLTSLRK